VRGRGHYLQLAPRVWIGAADRGHAQHTDEPILAALRQSVAAQQDGRRGAQAAVFRIKRGVIRRRIVPEYARGIRDRVPLQSRPNRCCRCTGHCRQPSDRRNRPEQLTTSADKAFFVKMTDFNFRTASFVPNPITASRTVQS